MSAGDGAGPPDSKRFAAPRAQAPRSRLALVAAVAPLALWFPLMRRFGAGIYALMGPFALGVILLVSVVFRERLREWLRPSWLAVGVGLLVGASMTIATYPLYAVACSLYPGLRVDVAVLYGAASATSLSEAVPWVLTIIVAEELLWRGALLDVFDARVSPRVSFALALATYCLAQAGTGSWIVTLLALVCGTLWTLQRRLTRSVLSPLIAHLIWTPTVILLLPVNAPP